MCVDCVCIGCVFVFVFLCLSICLSFFPFIPVCLRTMQNMDAEGALAAELQESKRRAEELQALLDAERRRASEAETKLKEREKLLQEAQRKPVDKELADKQRSVLTQVSAMVPPGRAAAEGF